MPVELRLFASAREAAGVDRDTVPGRTVEEVLSEASIRYGASFRAILPSCRIWVNGEQVEYSSPVQPGDEVAVLPPVSGG